MENEKNNTSVLLKILLVLFALFLIMYVSKEAGYYEYRTYAKKELTSEAIKKFESDVSLGKDVSIKDYVEDEYIDYSNIVTNTGSKIGSTIEEFMNEGIKKTIEILGRLFYK